MNPTAFIEVIQAIAPMAFATIEPFLRKKPNNDQLLMMVFATVVEHNAKEMEMWREMEKNGKQVSEALVVLLERTKP